MRLTGHAQYRLWCILLAALVAACGTRPSKSDDRDLDGVADAQDRCPLSTPGADVDREGCEDDADADHVADALDRCPNTPQGALVDLVGCEIDGDCDGVPDRIDQCPRTLLGVRVNAIGCEPTCPDRDNDGVCDDVDACPNTPPDTPVDERGCEQGELIVIEGVFFDTDRADLRPEARDVLQSIVTKLKGRTFQRLTIAGHTDSRNTQEYNQDLSLRRANSVRDYLVAEGIPAEKISTAGMGEMTPVASNKTVEGRARNRRVELRIIGSEGVKIESRFGTVPKTDDIAPKFQKGAPYRPVDDPAGQGAPEPGASAPPAESAPAETAPAAEKSEADDAPAKPTMAAMESDPLTTSIEQAVTSGPPPEVIQASTEPAESGPANAQPDPAADEKTTEPKATESKPSAAPAAAAPSGSDRWTIVVQSFQQRAVADRHLAKLRDAGYAATLQEIEINGKPWSRIQIPGYATVASTKDVIEKLKENYGYPDPWVMRSKP